MHFELNGADREYLGDPVRSLLDHLREDLGVTSLKNGCAPQGACGGCTVHIDGKAKLACVTPMEKLSGRAVRTMEGIEPHAREVLATCFADRGAVQCGFCSPGMVMRAHALLCRHAAPSRSEIERALTPHLCRCTGYVKIIDAIEEAAAQLAMPADTSNAAPEALTGRLGTRLVKPDAYALALGARAFVADMAVPGMRHAALRFSDHPRARVLGLDLDRARRAPGVLAVLTATDIPGERHTGLIVADWPLMVAVGETTRCVGDVLACVVAETRAEARAAADLIQVRYQVLAPVLDPFDALEPDAPRVHEGGNRLSVSKARVGDFEAAWEQCAHRVEGTWRTQRVDHAFLEPECCLVLPRDQGVEVFSQGQGVYEDRHQIASLLGLPEQQVIVELVPNGGGFGGKEDLTVQGHAALAAFRLGAPVRLELSRAESLRFHPKRHPVTLHLEVGCTADGRLHALRARDVGDTGAYASVGMKVLERVAGHATGAYHCPNVDVEAIAVYTNNVPSGAFRGFGANQAVFALEGALDMLAELGGFDRWQLRWDNALTEGRSTSTGQVLKAGVGVRATLEVVKPWYDRARHSGLACGLKNTGIGNGMPDVGRVRIDVVSPERVEVHHGWTDMGQGVNTIAVQFLCEETGIDPAKVAVIVDTRSELVTGMTTASRATSLLGNAILDACSRLAPELAELGLEGLVGRRYPGEWVCDWTTKPGHEDGREICTHFSYGYATQLVVLDDEGRIEEVVAAHDAGRVVNPSLFEGQIEGAVHMGLGYALTEQLRAPGGFPSERLNDCGVLRAHATPKITPLAVEVPDPVGPHGAKGVGEIGLVPTAAAVANAYARFDGLRPFSLPLRRPAPRRRDPSEARP